MHHCMSMQPGWCIHANMNAYTNNENWIHLQADTQTLHRVLKWLAVAQTCVNKDEECSRSRNNVPMQPSTFSTRLAAFCRVYSSTLSAQFRYFVLGKNLKAYFCNSSTLLSRLSCGITGQIVDLGLGFKSNPKSSGFAAQCFASGESTSYSLDRACFCVDACPVLINSRQSRLLLLTHELSWG